MVIERNGWLWVLVVVVIALIAFVIFGRFIEKRFNPLLRALNAEDARTVVAFPDPGTGKKILVLSVDGHPLTRLCSSHDSPCDDKLIKKLEVDYEEVLKVGQRELDGNKIEHTSSHRIIPELINSATADLNDPPCDRYISMHGGKVIYMDPDPCNR